MVGSWIGRNIEKDGKNTTKELITNGSIILDETNACIAKIDGIEKDQSLVFMAESKPDNENKPLEVPSKIHYHFYSNLIL